MKVQIICEKCNKVVELTPQTQGQLSSIGVIRDYFSIEEDIDVSLNSDLDENFITSLTEVDSQDEVREILENEITENVEHESNLNELRINCKYCGEYIILNNF